MKSRQKLHLCTFKVKQVDSLMGKTFFAWFDGTSEIFQFWNMDFSVLVHLPK